MTLKEIPQEWILKAALRILSKTQYKDAPAFVAVMDLCGIGRTSACDICGALNIDPYDRYQS